MSEITVTDLGLCIVAEYSMNSNGVTSTFVAGKSIEYIGFVTVESWMEEREVISFDPNAPATQMVKTSKWILRDENGNLISDIYANSLEEAFQGNYGGVNSGKYMPRGFPTCGHRIYTGWTVEPE